MSALRLPRHRTLYTKKTRSSNGGKLLEVIRDCGAVGDVISLIRHRVSGCPGVVDSISIYGDHCQLVQLLLIQVSLWCLCLA